MAHDLGDQTQAHYERHPYPAGTVLDWCPQVRHQLNYFSGRGGDAAIAPDARILVAGCGTREAALWGLQMPDAQVVGVDFSEASLTRSRALVDALSLDHVTLQRADIMTLSPGDLGEPFDLIVSYGVVHHLRDPQEGLTRLGRLLTPDGLMQLMVYSATHRRPVRELDQISDRLTPAGADAETRVSALIALADE
ncbi:MAG: class I SAM-dependent methyltransferase, partial [Myxococcota bacterium]|nr:class I SAM-dependent methyltransferase [Myxococcota bacterium]